MQNIVKRFSNPRLLILLVILVLINLALFSVPSLSGSRPRILALAPEYTVPDMKGIYSPEYVYDFLSVIGPEGRHAYQMMHYTTDLAFPILYGLLLFASLCRLTELNPRINRHLPLIALIPSVSDLVENFSMVTITAKYPEYLPGLTRFSQGFTFLKFGGIAFCLAVIIFLSIRQKIKRQ